MTGNLNMRPGVGEHIIQGERHLDLFFPLERTKQGWNKQEVRTAVLRAGCDRPAKPTEGRDVDKVPTANISASFLQPEPTNKTLHLLSTLPLK